MFKRKIFKSIKSVVIAFGSLALLLSLTLGSVSLAQNKKEAAEVKSPKEVKSIEKIHEVAKGGAALWAANCQRCHNYRPPSTYNDAEWEVAVMHMRFVANLTTEEYEEILRFLKNANY